ncbi:23S rRNA Uracil-5-methyltransferase [Nitzschia inconspicua]|uniref:23S rRNA Uracil-5-methyltransferase n=1 Tax=Nitzschia inconspicua TaxID=303405 RepID=A0A9K3KNT2_9STRA|nr:23S rRNA Uracil-5-methyltransferase [Nitzschia inconspicua]
MLNVGASGQSSPRQVSLPTMKGMNLINVFLVISTGHSFLSPKSSFHQRTIRQSPSNFHSQTLTVRSTSSSSSRSQNKKRQSSSNSGNRRQQQNSNKNKSSFSGPKPPPSSRPLLTLYDEQRNRVVNRERLTKPIDCQHFGTCPGCIVNDHVGKVDVIRSATRFFSSTAIRKNRLDVERSGEDWVVEAEDDGFYQVVVPSDVTQWRTQAKLVVAPKSSSWAKDGCIFGLYQRGSHDVLEIPNCQVHHPSINRAVELLEQATTKVGTPAYNSDSRDGQGLRYVQLQVERTTGKICLTLVFGASDVKATQPSLSRLTKELTKLDPDLWHSMWCHTNDAAGNNIFSRNTKNWHRLSGPEFVREPLPVGEFGWLYFSPLAFRQGNMEGFDILANDVARAVPGGSRVCELYAGVGLLGLTSLAYHHDTEPLEWVRCSDENPANPRCFTRSIQSIPRETIEHPKQNGPAPALTLGDIRKQMESGDDFWDVDPSTRRFGPKATYTVASAGYALKSGQALGANVMIVDPPRKGLEDDVLEELCKPFNPRQPNVESPNMMTLEDYYVNWTNDVQTLIYVSCGFDALARDAEKLLSSPAGWKLESATGYVLFPGTNHVETLCIFQRE